jgi:hypothetical protein
VEDATLKRLAWVLRRSVDTLGFTGMTGLILITAAAIVCIGSVLPLAHDIADIEAEIASLRHGPAPVRNYAPEEEIRMFYDFFPDRHALPQQLRTLHRIAHAADLPIEQADYKLTRVQGTPLWRYRISFPLNTDYVTLRRFLADVLKALPNAALADVELQRGEADAELLQERIDFVLFFREPS